MRLAERLSEVEPGRQGGIPGFSNGTSGVTRLVLIFSTSSSASGSNPSRCRVNSHAVVFSM